MKKLVYGVGLNDTVGMSQTIEYKTWYYMLKLAKFVLKKSVEDGISAEFKTFSKFRDWYLKQAGCGEKGFCITERLSDRINKQFNSNMCVLVPRQIYTLCKDKESFAIKYRDYSDSYDVYISSNYQKLIGNLKTRDEALLAYQNTAKEYIEELLNKYRDKLDNRVVAALQNFTL